MTRAQVIEAEAFAKAQRERLARKFKLVDAQTGAEIILPATRKCDRGPDIKIVNFEPVKYQTSGGYIYTDQNEVLVPSVCGAKIIEFPENPELLEAAGVGGMR